jgi:hypothetical protein
MKLQRCANCRRARPNFARNLCQACYKRARYHGRIEEWPLGAVGRPLSPGSYAGIARELGVSPPTVKLAEAQRRLRWEDGRWVLDKARRGRRR